MPLPALLATGGRVLSGLGGLSNAASTIEGMFSGWIPKVQITNRVKVQGRRGTSVRTTLHFALATAYGMSISRNGDKFAITVNVDQRTNVAEVEYTLESTSLGAMIRGLPQAKPAPENPLIPPQNRMPAFPGIIPNTGGRELASSTLSTGDEELRDAIVGIKPSPAQLNYPDPTFNGGDLGNPTFVPITPTTPVVRGIFVNVTQPEPVKAPWLVVRENV